MTKYQKTLENSESNITKFGEEIKSNEAAIKQAEEDVVKLEQDLAAVTE